MNSVTFHKMVASGNDFILVDNRKKVIQDPKSFAKKVCPFHASVGADGVLLLETSRRADYFLRVINADGSEAEACGNGYRLAGLFANQILKSKKRVRFETLAGDIQVEVNGRGAKVLMAQPKDFRRDIFLDVAGRKVHCVFINTGVPHAVIFSEDLDEAPVFELGRAIRYHEHFKPAGTNVNFVSVAGENRLTIRTYERGVEEETLACGTGSVAAAIVSVLTGRVSIPVEVETKGGVLKVHFSQKGESVSDVYLEGDAKFVYEGKLLV